MTNKEKFFDAVEKGRLGKNLGLSIGSPKLMNFIDGYLPETSYLIGALSGAGKSTYVLYSFVYKPLMDFLNGNLPNRDPYWIMFSLEMTSEQIYSKLISLYIFEHFGEELSFKEMFSRGKDCMLSDDKFELLQQCDEFLNILDKRIIFYEGTLNAEKYKNFVLTTLQKFGHFSGETYYPNNPERIIGVIVDHCSLIRATNGRSKKEEMDLMSSYSVQLRNRYKISPIHVMQFNRDASNQERMKQDLQEPTYNDFKDSGTIKINFILYLQVSEILYIRADSKDKFTDLIEPYIHENCKYKLHCRIKTPLNGETPVIKKDNSVLNLHENEENA